MKQTAVEQLGYAFRKWQKDWDNFEKIGKNKPIPFDEFMKPFLEMEKQQIVDGYWSGCANWDNETEAEQYYNETYKGKNEV